MSGRNGGKSKAEAEVIQAEYPGAENDDLVTLALAHPLNEEDRRRLGLPLDADTGVNVKVAVSKNAARSIINAGYAQVDPENRAQVSAALGGASPEEVAEVNEPDSEPAATSGN